MHTHQKTLSRSLGGIANAANANTTATEKALKIDGESDASK